MTELLVATEDIVYCSPEDARLFAVEALLLSKGRGVRFYDAYYGLVSFHLKAWIEDNGDQVEKHYLQHLFKLVNRTEHIRFILNQEGNNFISILSDEIIPISTVIHQIVSGSNKEKAISEAEDMLSYRNGYYEGLRELPKGGKNLSKRTIERIWKKYLEVPHYAWLRAINQIRQMSGIEAVTYENGREVWGQIMSAVDAVSTTKQMSIPEPIFLRFVTDEEFQKHLPEIPPRS
ncbi:hypothetical protein [Albirhodobacter sp. R86504]|uniref:hypothetical protein n=1 Tax=Albirhodobacter sp. R86504 TaxID=3093848 RepID=UPI00366CAB17